MNPIHHSHCWKNNFDGMGELMPVWPTTPDVSIIRDLAKKYLSQGFTDMKVEYFAEGALNKLYNVLSPNISQQYLMRVALPVDPFLKVESEVATLVYVRTHTSIPVPKVIAYNSNSENPLGFEWILLEKIGGIPLVDAWKHMDIGRRVKLTEALAENQQQLASLPFPKIGNLYFSDVQNQISDRIICSNRSESEDSTKPHDSNAFTSSNETAKVIETKKSIPSGDSTVVVNWSIANKFFVGPKVSPSFFIGKRVLLSSDRGPFSSSCELMLARARLQIESIKNLSPLPTDDYYCENDEELAPHQDEILEICNKLIEIIPDWFSPVDNGKSMYTLFHDDLTDRNIIVDPTTYCITGIVDWESVCIRPPWETYTYPEILRGRDPGPREPPPATGSDTEDFSTNDWRNDYDKTRLRKVYLEHLQSMGKGLNGIPLIHPIDDDVKYKRWFARLLADIEPWWTGTKHWIPRLRSKDFDCMDRKAMNINEV